jgi:repressor LexA
MRYYQRKIYKVIKEYIEDYGYSPTYREIADLAYLNSPATIHHHMKKLKEEGYIDFEPKRNRTVRIIKELED